MPAHRRTFLQWLAKQVEKGECIPVGCRDCPAEQENVAAAVTCSERHQTVAQHRAVILGAANLLHLRHPKHMRLACRHHDNASRGEGLARTVADAELS